MKKILNHKYLPYILLLVYIILIHSGEFIRMGDDTRFTAILENNTMLEALKLRYNTWSSRILIELVLFKVVHYPFLWKILDIVICMLFVVGTEKVFLAKNNSNKVRWIIVALFIAYPMNDLNSAGWIATTLNYTWPFAFLLLSFILVKKVYLKQHVSIIEGMFYLLCLSFGANQEQYAAVATCTFIMALIIILAQRRFSIWMLLGSIISLGELIFILTCPGNDARMIAEIAHWYPTFDNLNFVELLYTGITNTLSAYFKNFNMIYFIFTFTLCIGIWNKYKSVFYRLLAIIPILAPQCLGFTNSFKSTRYANYSNFVSGDALTLDNYYNYSTYMTASIYLIVCIIICILLYLYFEDKINSFLCWFILAMGFANRVVLGFSPTIYASGRRTFFVLYAAFILVTVVMVKCSTDKKEIQV